MPLCLHFTQNSCSLEKLSSLKLVPISQNSKSVEIDIIDFPLDTARSTKSSNDSFSLVAHPKDSEDNRLTPVNAS